MNDTSARLPSITPIGAAGHDRARVSRRLITAYGTVAWRRTCSESKSSRLLPFLGPSGANLIVARGAILTTTPNRFTQTNNDIENQCCKNGGDHRFSDAPPSRTAVARH